MDIRETAQLNKQNDYYLSYLLKTLPNVRILNCSNTTYSESYHAKKLSIQTSTTALLKSSNIVSQYDVIDIDTNEEEVMAKAFDSTNRGVVIELKNKKGLFGKTHEAIITNIIKQMAKCGFNIRFLKMLELNNISRYYFIKSGTIVLREGVNYFNTEYNPKPM